MIIILNYHSISNNDIDTYTVTPERLEKQLKYFSKKCELVSLDQLLTILKNGIPTKKYGLVTFDDGYQDNLLNALPILEKYKIPAAFFISAGLVGKIFYGKPLLTWDEIRILAEKNFITIGSHGMEHENYAQITMNEIRDKLELSKKMIEEKLSKKILAFAFPYAKFNGDLSKINNNTYKLIFSKNGCLFSGDYSTLDLPRVTIYQGVSFLKFKFLLTRTFWFLKKTLNK
jgi:peptidoglycan/xylan/chitin deacetylase (PgdA/CDA1 family)